MLPFEGGKAGAQIETGELLTILFVCSNLLLQGVIIHRPTGMDVVHEERNLPSRRIHPILVGLEHASRVGLHNYI